jgi:probable HAF family extracellular repeat protein
MPVTGPAYPTVINNKGQVAGTNNVSSGSINRYAFLPENGGAMINLNTLARRNGLILASATGINDKAQIVGQRYKDVVLSNYAITSTPMPPSILLFGSKLAGPGLFRQKVRT